MHHFLSTQTYSAKPRKRKKRPGGGGGVGMLTPPGYQLQRKPQFRSNFGGGSRVNRKNKVT